MPEPFVIKQGDTTPSIAATLYDANGAPRDLTGCAVKFIFARADGQRAPKSAAAIIVSPTAGTVRYDWVASDTAEHGSFVGEFQVTIGGATTTYPNDGNIDLVITKQVGS